MSSICSCKIITIDPVSPRPDLIAEAAAVIKKGGIVMFPTRCLYGLAADAFNREAVDRIFTLKRRPADKPLLILVSRVADLTGLVKSVPPDGCRIMSHFWPGKVTIVMEASDGLPINLTAGTGTVGVRVPEHPVAYALVNAAKRPITATSANITGCGGCSQIADLDPAMADQLDLILDAGPLKGGIGSTLVDVSGNIPTVLREGRISAGDIWAALA